MSMELQKFGVRVKSRMLLCLERGKLFLSFTRYRHWNILFDIQI